MRPEAASDYEGSDRALWQAVQRGDAEAFGVIFDRHASRIFSYCFQSTADPETAKDVTSIVFLEAWRRRNAPTFTDDLVRAWLYGIATNVLRNQRRSQRRYRAALERMPRVEVEPDFTDEVDSRLGAIESMQLIKAALRDVPRRERECLALCTWQGLTSREASIALGIPPETVRSRLHRAHERIRRQMVAAEAESGRLSAERSK